MRSENIKTKQIHKKVQQEKLSKCVGTPLVLGERKALQPDKTTCSVLKYTLQE